MTAVAVVVALLVPHGVDGSPWESVTATAPAVRVATTVQVAEPPPTLPATPDWARCPQYWDLARQVGWPEDQLPTLDYVAHRESHCNPHAVGSIPVRGKRAQGLMQLLGWDCPPNGCYDPTSNLAKALELWRTSGWCPWVLRGDPVTGRACG